MNSRSGLSMEDERDAFYVVRKGDVVGIYRSLSECQEQAGSSVCHPSMSVYKGYGWPKTAEELVASYGLKNAAFCISANHVKDDMFGKLIPCPVQQPSSPKGSTIPKTSPPKRSQEMVKAENGGGDGSISFAPNLPMKQARVDNRLELSMTAANCASSSHKTFEQSSNIVPSQKHNSAVMQEPCIIEFDGASKGNPGQAGSGAVLRTTDGRVVYCVREGIGIATNNVAEYRALILGMKVALKKGFRHVDVRGDSMLVCMQVQDLWKTKHPKMAELCKQAKELMNQFLSFQIKHVDRELNSEADTQANYAIYLPEGQTEEIYGGMK